MKATVHQDGKSIRIRPRTGDGSASASDAVPSGPTEALYASEPFQALVQAMYDAMLIADLKGWILQVSPRAEEMLGTPAAELVGSNVSSLLTGIGESMLDALLPGLHRSRFALVQAWCGRNRGQERFAAEVALSLLQSRPERLCLFLRDITSRKQAETILQTGYNAMQNAASGIVILDPRGQVEYINPAAQALWGANSETSMLGRSLASLVRDESSILPLLDATTGRQETWKGEVSARRLDGGAFIAQITAACNRNTQGLPIGTVVSIQDVTDAREAEERIREADRQGAMLASLGAACHHLAQPATVLIGNLGILEQISASLPEEARELVRTAQEAADRLTSILHRLNEVNEYRTTPYLDSVADTHAPENRMLEI